MFSQTRFPAMATLGLALALSTGATAQAPQTDPGSASGRPGMWMMPGMSGPMGDMSEADIDRMRQFMQRMGMGPGMGRGAMAPRAMRALGRVEGRLAYFRTELGITEAQTPQWNSFADVVRNQARTLRQAYERAMQQPAAGQQPGSGAPQAPAVLPMMERHLTLMRAQLDAAQAVLAAMGPLYAALTDEQKRNADALMIEHLREQHGLR